MRVRIQQIKSVIGMPETQKRTIRALGLGKINRTIEGEMTPSLQGMIRAVHHLVKVTEI